MVNGIKVVHMYKDNGYEKVASKMLKRKGHNNKNGRNIIIF